MSKLFSKFLFSHYQDGWRLELILRFMFNVKGMETVSLIQVSLVGGQRKTFSSSDAGAGRMRSDCDL